MDTRYKNPSKDIIQRVSSYQQNEGREVHLDAMSRYNKSEKGLKSSRKYRKANIESNLQILTAHENMVKGVKI